MCWFPKNPILNCIPQLANINLVDPDARDSQALPGRRVLVEGQIPYVPATSGVTWPAQVRFREGLRGLNGELGLRQIEHILLFTKPPPPTVPKDALRTLHWPPPGNHGNALRSRGEFIPGDTGIHPLAPVSQHKLHATRPNLEQKYLMHVDLVVTLRNLLASPSSPTILLQIRRGIAQGG